MGGSLGEVLDRHVVRPEESVNNVREDSGMPSLADRIPLFECDSRSPGWQHVMQESFAVSKPSLMQMAKTEATVTVTQHISFMKMRTISLFISVIN